ncbi:MAG TPA: DUF3489 domain-containing protein [Rhizomicrobium sp.]
MPKTSSRVRLHMKPTACPPPKFRLGGSVRAPRYPRKDSKLAQILTLLLRPAGVSIAELIKVTGWREPSIRAALSGVMKRRLGLRITSVKSYDRCRRYYGTEDGARSRLPKDAAQ